jgi:hypothetical protein
LRNLPDQNLARHAAFLFGVALVMFGLALTVKRAMQVVVPPSLLVTVTSREPSGADPRTVTCNVIMLALSTVVDLTVTPAPTLATAPGGNRNR